MCEKINSTYNNIDIVLSPAIGGIVVGYEIGRQLELETIFAERSAGELILRRGFKIPENSNVLVVEDVITTGKSALECSAIIKKNNSKVVGYACIVDRSDKEVLIKDNIISQVKFEIKTFKENQLPEELSKIQPTKPGSKKLTK